MSTISTKYLTDDRESIRLSVMNDSRHIKDLLYEQVARIGKAACSPKRLELIELLCQGEKSVETLAREAAVSVKLASAHLRELRAARLVETEKHGKYVIYRIANREVADFWVSIRSLAEDRLVELRMVIEQMVSHPKELAPQDRESLVKMARKGGKDAILKAALKHGVAVSTIYRAMKRLEVQPVKV